MRKIFLLPILLLPACAGFHSVEMTSDPAQQQQERTEKMNDEANDAATGADKSGEPQPAR